MQLSLGLLLGLVIGGVGAVVALTWAVGWSAEATIEGPAPVRRIWARTHPEHAVTRVVVDDSARVALLELGDGTTGLVFVHGDQLVSRHLGPGDVKHAQLRGDHLSLGLHGFARPSVRIHLKEAAARSAWHARLAHRT